MLTLMCALNLLCISTTLFRGFFNKKKYPFHRYFLAPETAKEDNVVERENSQQNFSFFGYTKLWTEDGDGQTDMEFEIVFQIYI